MRFPVESVFNSCITEKKIRMANFFKTDETFGASVLYSAHISIQISINRLIFILKLLPHILKNCVKNFTCHGLRTPGPKIIVLGQEFLNCGMCKVNMGSAEARTYGSLKRDGENL